MSFISVKYEGSYFILSFALLLAKEKNSSLFIALLISLIGSFVVISFMVFSSALFVLLFSMLFYSLFSSELFPLLLSFLPESKK